MKKFLFTSLIICSMLLLEACVPAVFVAGAATGGAVLYDSRNMQTMIEDRDITNKVQAKLRGNQKISHETHLNVTTFNHVLLIVGQAKTEELRQKAISLVERVPNIKRVYNEITVEQLIPLKERSRDVWLTTKVKTALISEKGLRYAQIKIVTENSNVYLLGLVNKEQAELAADIARQISGVQKVVKVFEYI
jgi:osmotically-inducible protein OsmY